MRAAALRRSQPGLTLIEVICALAIGAMLMATLLGTLTLTARAITEAGQTARQSRIETGLERILRHDLTAAVQPNMKEVVAFNGRPTVPSEVSEDPCLDFFTTRSLSPDASSQSGGIARVTYVLRTGGEAEGRLDLLRRETEYTPGKTPPDRPLERLATGITVWQLSFYDGRQWLAQWKRNVLPAAVKLELSFEGEKRRALTELVFAPLATTDATPSIP